MITVPPSPPPSPMLPPPPPLSPPPTPPTPPSPAPPSPPLPTGASATKEIRVAAVLETTLAEFDDDAQTSAAIATGAATNTFMGQTTAVTPSQPTVSTIVTPAPSPPPPGAVPPVDGLPGTNTNAQTGGASGSKSLEGWAVALIVVMSSLFVFAIAMLGVVIMRERSGQPMFVVQKDVVQSSTTNRDQEVNSL